MFLIQKYIELESLSCDSSQAALVKRKVGEYTAVEETLYKICLSKFFHQSANSR